jgi:DmsE family decaheme c-type cytochrome
MSNYFATVLGLTQECTGTITCTVILGACDRLQPTTTITSKKVHRNARRVALAVASIFLFSCLGLSSGNEIEECRTCHSAIADASSGTKHGQAAVHHQSEMEPCSTCHQETGPHPKVPNSITNPAKLKPEIATEFCLTCHLRDRNRQEWRGSPHESNGLSCLSCHSEHGKSDGPVRLIRSNELESCGGCHKTERDAMRLRSTHLIRDEHGRPRVQCSSCHNPHGGGENLLMATNPNALCFGCHQEKRGPFLWEHAPVQEGCNNCHTSHGSRQERLLTLRMPLLCVSCHVQQRHQVVPGRVAPNNTNVMLLNRSCTNCHSAIHGSNHPSGAVFTSRLFGRRANVG